MIFCDDGMIDLDQCHGLVHSSIHNRQSTLQNLYVV
jgi:hypothetical protein